MRKRTVRRVVVYARKSQSDEKSVSIPDQIEKSKHYAAAKGWEVAGVFVDDGISASYNKPVERAGWRELMKAGPEDAVIVWRVDRLARRLTDFWNTFQVLDTAGSSMVSVQESLDMTTAMGRTFAGIIAGFAEVEAEAISMRVTAARTHLIKSGRTAGGVAPYGWCTIPNPDGEGKVLARDPETTGVVREIVDRIQAGATIYSVVQWLNESKVPTKTQRTSTWRYNTVEGIVRNPVLAGLVAFNPGWDGKTKHRGAEVLRDERGLPQVHPELAVMPLPEWRAMVKQLDDRDSAQTTPRARRAKTSSLLSGLMWCGDPRHDEPIRMYRGTLQGRPSYYCPKCHMALSGAKFEDVIIEDFLVAKGDWPHWRVLTEVYEGEAALLPEIENRLEEIKVLIDADPGDDELEALQKQQAALIRDRREARRSTPEVRLVPVGGEPQVFAADWEQAEAVEERRAVLDDALARVIVRRGAGGGTRSEERIRARLTYEWLRPEETGPTSDEKWWGGPE